MLHLDLTEIKNKTGFVIEGLPWVQQIVEQIYASAENGTFDGVLYAKDYPALNDNENVRKLSFLLRHRGFFVKVDHDQENGLYVSVSWDWTKEKQEAIDLSEAIGDQLLLAIDSINNDNTNLQDIKEILGAYCLAKVKGNHADYRNAINTIEEHVKKDAPEE